MLIVEDDEIHQAAIEQMLKRCINRVVVRAQADGAAALSDVVEFKPDLLILDLHLPGKSGHDVLRELREDNADLPVLVFSSDKQAMFDLMTKQRGGSDQTVAVLDKLDHAHLGLNVDEFVRLVPTLFKRRQSDAAVNALADHDSATAAAAM